MKSNFSKLKQEIEALKCQDCGGLGEMDDSDLGDIMFNRWICQRCEGTGWQDQIERQLTIKQR